MAAVAETFFILIHDAGDASAVSGVEIVLEDTPVFVPVLLEIGITANVGVPSTDDLILLGIFPA